MEDPIPSLRGPESGPESVRAGRRESSRPQLGGGNFPPAPAKPCPRAPPEPRPEPGAQAFPRLGEEDLAGFSPGLRAGGSGSGGHCPPQASPSRRENRPRLEPRVGAGAESARPGPGLAAAPALKASVLARGPGRRGGGDSPPAGGSWASLTPDRGLPRGAGGGPGPPRGGARL